jgi:hypothetical protein
MVLDNTLGSPCLYLKFGHFSIQIVNASKFRDRKRSFLPKCGASPFQDIPNGSDMINEGKVVEDDADAANGIGSGKKCLDVEIPYEGAEVKSGCDVGKI